MIKILNFLLANDLFQKFYLHTAFMNIFANLDFLLPGQAKEKH